jgi:hypothetical protein
VRAVQITVMREAVRQAVIDARSPKIATAWLSLPGLAMTQAADEETVARSKAEILKEASQAMLAQANQTRESVRSLLQATD